MNHSDFEAQAKGIKVWRVRTGKGKAQADLERIVREAADRKTEVAVLNAEMVFGADHVRCAYYHARKAHAEGRNASPSLAMETILYASGERQLGTALKKMAVNEDSEELVVAEFSGGTSLASPGWEPLEDRPHAVSLSGLIKYGLTKEELATIGKGREAELVLEKVASVDVLKK